MSRRINHCSLFVRGRERINVYAAFGPLRSIAKSGCWSGPAALLIVVDHLRCRFPHPDLCAHLLQTCSKRFDLLLLVRGSRLEVFLQLHDGRFLFPHFAMFFKELVQQHRIHRFVADGVRLAMVVARH